MEGRYQGTFDPDHDHAVIVETHTDQEAYQVKGDSECQCRAMHDDVRVVKRGLEPVEPFKGGLEGSVRRRADATRACEVQRTETASSFGCSPAGLHVC